MDKVSGQGDVCSYKRSFALDNYLRKLIQSPKKIVGPYLKPEDIVIDLGCGPGFFTTEMALMVGATGNVVAVDLQQEMLDKVAGKVWNTELAKTIKLHQCSQDELNLSSELQADFILAFYMVHETPDALLFLQQVKKHLKPGGKFLIVEPLFHVSKKKFSQIEKDVEACGFKLIERPKRKGGKSLLLTI